MKSPPTAPEGARAGVRAVMSPAMIVGLAAIAIIALVVITGRLAVIEGAIVVIALGIITALGTSIRSLTSQEPEAGTALAGPDLSVRRFADTLTEPCLLINERAVLVFANPAAQMQFPRLREGDPLAFTLRDPDLVEAIDTALATGQTQRAELHITAPNETWFRASIVPYVPAEGSQTLLVVTLYDLTEQKRTDKMRGDFVANASHELRTPLTSLRGFIETLQGPASRDEAARTKFLSIMQGQAERMSGLIDDLLSLSRIELRQHVRPTETVAIGRLVREAVEPFGARALDAGIAISVHVPEGEVNVTGDRQELFEVVENLLENAIKYGGGRVDISVMPDTGRNGDQHSIVVSDNGPGIAQEHVPRLTERFYRVDGDASRKQKGTGLGLAIVKHIVARHHGQLAIKSALGEGRGVEVLLPSLRPASAPPVTQAK